VTVGHVAAVVNIYTVAGRCRLKLSNGQGPAIRAEMGKLQQIPWPTGLLSDVNFNAMGRSSDTSSQVHAALMALDGVCGWIMHKLTGFHRRLAGYHPSPPFEDNEINHGPSNQSSDD